MPLLFLQWPESHVSRVSSSLFVLLLGSGYVESTEVPQGLRTCLFSFFSFSLIFCRSGLGGHITNISGGVIASMFFHVRCPPWLVGKETSSSLSLCCSLDQLETNSTWISLPASRLGHHLDRKFASPKDRSLTIKYIGWGNIMTENEH